MPQERHSIAIMAATNLPFLASEHKSWMFFRSVRSKESEIDLSHSRARIPHLPAARPTPPVPPKRSARYGVASLGPSSG
eukprot:7683105-Pyramimonas_sp.AAC.1